MTFNQRLRARSADFWLRFFFFHARHVPPAARWTKWFFLFFALRYSRKIRRATFANADRLLGPSLTERDRRAFSARVVSNFYDFVCDVARGGRLSLDRALARIESSEGVEHYRAARELHRGAIVATAHMGSFEAGIASIRALEPHVHVVFKRDAIDSFETARKALHARLGVREAPIDEGWTIWMRLRDALQRDEVVLLQADRVMPGQKGLDVEMLGHRASVPTGPAKLALASGGAPIVPVFSVRGRNGKIRMFIEPALVPSAEDDAASLTRSLASVIEQYVARFPDQWLLLEPAFCDDATTAPQPTMRRDAGMASRPSANAENAAGAMRETA